MTTTTLSTIELCDLDRATGGVSKNVVKKGAKKFGKALLKKAGPIGLAITGYDAVNAGIKSRKQGNGWGTVIKDALWGAIW